MEAFWTVEATNTNYINNPQPNLIQKIFSLNISQIL